MFKYSHFFIILLTTALSLPQHASAQQERPSTNLVDKKFLSEINGFINTDIVMLSTINQNKKYEGIGQDQIDALDKQWRSETKSSDQPLISATLSNPLSTYLTRIQAHSVGLYSEIFVMDSNGLNVGQSNISSDYWQGDEDKFKKTFPVGGSAVFVDEPEFDDELGVWKVQVNMPLTDKSGSSIGAVTVEVNLSELERRRIPSG